MFTYLCCPVNGYLLVNKATFIINNKFESKLDVNITSLNAED